MVMCIFMIMTLTIFFDILHPCPDWDTASTSPYGLSRRKPIQVSLYFKTNNALFHIYYKWFLMSILGFPGCLTRPPSLGHLPQPNWCSVVQWSWSGHLAIWSCCRWPDVSFIFRFNFHHKIISRLRTTSELLDLQLALAGERGPVVCDFRSMTLCSP